MSVCRTAADSARHVAASLGSCRAPSNRFPSAAANFGIVVHSDREFKQQAWTEEQLFQVHYNANLDAEQAGHILDSVAGYMHRDRP